MKRGPLATLRRLLRKGDPIEEPDFEAKDETKQTRYRLGYRYEERREYIDGSIADNLRCCASLVELSEWEAKAAAAADASSGTKRLWARIIAAKRRAMGGVAA